MKFDEYELIEFFGVLPIVADPEAAEFFSSSYFEAVEGQIKLCVSFSRTHPPKVMIDLMQTEGGEPFLSVRIDDAYEVRTYSKPQCLVVLAEPKGPDSCLGELVAIYLNPLKVVISR